MSKQTQDLIGADWGADETDVHPAWEARTAPTVETRNGWTGPEKVLFRFVFLYFLIQALPLDGQFFRNLTDVDGGYTRYLFNLSHYAPRFFDNEDTFANWAVVLLIAAIGTLVWSGRVRSGRVRSGRVRSGRVRSGRVRSGRVRSGRVRSGRVRSGRVRSGRVRSGRVRSGRVRSGRVRSGRVRSGRVRSGRVRSGRVRSGRVRSGRVRSGRVRSGRVRSGRRDKRPDYDGLYYGLRVVLRYRLAFGVLAYGFIKLFPIQAPLPSISNLNTAYGDHTAWKLVSLSLGVAPSYESFLGGVELLGGLLLLYRKTATIGTLILLPFLGNIFFSNLAYDGGEYVYSGLLITFALVLFAFDTTRLVRLLSLALPAAPNRFQPAFPTQWQRSGRLALKSGFVLIVVVAYGISAYGTYRRGSVRFLRHRVCRAWPVFIRSASFGWMAKHYPIPGSIPSAGRTWFSRPGIRSVSGRTAR